MSRYLSYNEETERLRKLLAEVSSDDESINESEEEAGDAIDDDDMTIDYRPSSDSESNELSEIEDITGDPVDTINSVINCVVQNYNSDTETDDVSENGDTFFIGRDGKTKWMKEKYRSNVRTPAKIIMLKLPGNTKYVKDISTPSQAWSIILDETMLDLLVKSTNIYIGIVRDKFIRERDAKDITKPELKAFIGLLYLGGLHLHF